MSANENVFVISDRSDTRLHWHRAVRNSKGKTAAHRNSRSKEQIKLRFQHTKMRVFLLQKSIAFCASCVCESAWGRCFFLAFLSWPLLCTGPMLAVLSLECRPPDCMCFFTACANSSEMLDFQVLHLCQQFFFLPVRWTRWRPTCHTAPHTELRNPAPCSSYATLPRCCRGESGTVIYRIWPAWGVELWKASR